MSTEVVDESTAPAQSAPPSEDGQARESSSSGWLTRLREAPPYYARGLYREISDRDVFLWAQAIAFKVLVTIVPLTVLATGIAGGVLRYDAPFSTVANFIREFLPPYQSDQLIGVLQRLQDAAPAITTVGAVGLLVTVITLFTTFRLVIARAFNEPWRTERTIVGGYRFDVRMVGQVGLLFITSIVLSFAMQALNALGADGLAAIGLTGTWLEAGWERLIAVASLLIPYLLTVAVLFQLYYFVPLPHPRTSSAWFGAIFGALLLELAKSGFAYYAAHVGRFNQYATDTDVTTGEGFGVLGESSAGVGVGEGFGLVVAFVFWIYYSGIVLGIGALLGLLHEKRRIISGRQPLPQADAPPAPRRTARESRGGPSTAKSPVPAPAD